MSVCNSWCTIHEAVEIETVFLVTSYPVILSKQSTKYVDDSLETHGQLISSTGLKLKKPGEYWHSRHPRVAQTAVLLVCCLSWVAAVNCSFGHLIYRSFLAFALHLVWITHLVSRKSILRKSLKWHGCTCLEIFNIYKAIFKAKTFPEEDWPSI